MIEFNLLLTIITIGVVFGAVQGICGYATLAERKISAWLQERKGPNRVGPFGMLQPLVDGVKFFLKEEIIPRHVDRLFYLVAPSIALTTAMIALCVTPFGRTTPVPGKHWNSTVTQEQQFEDSAASAKFNTEIAEYNNTYQYVIAPGIDIGIVFIFATGSLAAYAIVLGGWCSNNKYSVLGALRASAQMISYEIPLGMSVIGVILLAGSLNLEAIIRQQADTGIWNIAYQPLAALMFCVAIFAECNRLPFDLSECEQELVGGYHTEYNGMKFAFFFLGEYTHMVTTSFLWTLFFAGGWHLWFVTDDSLGVAATIIKLIVFMTKMILFIAFYMLVRWTIPRFRFDQLMNMAWKVLIPLSLLNLLAVMVVKHLGWSEWLLLPVSLGLFVLAGWYAVKMPTESQRRVMPKAA